MIIQKGFGYYWAVTIPLTLLILGAWGASMAIPHRNKGVLSDDIELESLRPIPTSNSNQRPTNNIFKSSNSSRLSRRPSIDNQRSRNSLHSSPRSSNQGTRASNRSRRTSAGSQRISTSNSPRSSWETLRASGDSQMTSNVSRRSTTRSQQ